MKDYKKLSEYGIIGNLDTCALVAKDGSIDWCCFPHIESPSVFASLLDIKNSGHFVIRPVDRFDSEQKYIVGTNVLQTVFKTSSGEATLTDLMPMGDGEKRHIQQSILRKIFCDKGSVEVELDFQPRFNYALSKTSLKAVPNGVLAEGDGKTIFLKSPIGLRIKNGEASSTHMIKEGENLWFVLQFGQKTEVDPEAALKQTVSYWNGWHHKCEAAKCVFGGPWHDLVVRSGLILKLLTHHESGAICAAPTTSLPEEIGGSRNWDYRFNWIRDSAFTVQALFNMGHVQEAKSYLKWFMSVCREAVEPDKLRIMYGLHGETDINEKELRHLSGYRGSAPVRVGNDAVNQRQLDIYGEVVNVVYETLRYEEEVSAETWQFVKKIVDHVCGVWNTTDAGIWEVRGKPQHFVYSKLMCWVALDRGIKIAEQKKFEADFTKWKKVREEIKEAILERGFNSKLNSFVQSFDSEDLDATSLLIPLMGFLPAEDKRVQGTIDAILKKLTTQEGLVYRYLSDDGLSGKEGTFILCSFWLVDALVLSGRVEEAEKNFENILKYGSPLGLLSEEIDSKTGELLGNFPQAFSHIGLINSALYLGMAKGKMVMGPDPVGGGKK